MDPSRTWKQEGSILTSINLEAPSVVQGGDSARGCNTEADAMTRTKAFTAKITPVKVATEPVSIRR